MYVSVTDVLTECISKPFGFLRVHVVASKGARGGNVSGSVDSFAQETYKIVRTYIRVDLWVGSLYC